jgi:hypothetical protein
MPAPNRYFARTYFPDRYFPPGEAGVETITGVGNITIAPITVSGTGVHPVSGRAAVTIPTITVSGTGVHPISGIAAVTIPTITATIRGLVGLPTPPIQPLQPSVPPAEKKRYNSIGSSGGGGGATAFSGDILAGYCNRCGIYIQRTTFKGRKPKYCDSCRTAYQDKWRRENL